MKILITGACAVSARSVLRSLKQSQIFKDAIFIGWDMCTLLYGVYAKSFDKLYKVPAVSDPFYERIAREIILNEKIDAAIIVPEVEVLFWSNKCIGVPCLLPPYKFSKLAISKERLFDALKYTDLVPKHISVSASTLLDSNFSNPLGFPIWIRDGAPGTASAKGALKALTNTDLRAWVHINGSIEQFQLSEYLPGANYGCFCLFKNGKLIKMCQAERIEYIMAKVALSGITGNTSKGRLLNDDRIKETALKAIDMICEQTGEKMNGLVVVDMKCKEDGTPVITEINLRHVAYSSMFATAGFNISEYQLLLALDRDGELPPGVDKRFPLGNFILRDVDGEPIYIEHIEDIKVGECICK